MGTSGTQSTWAPASLQQNQKQNLSSSFSKDNLLDNFYRLKSNESIVRKIQESKKRLEVLRLQNTFLLNSDLLSGNYNTNNRKRSWLEQQQHKNLSLSFSKISNHFFANHNQTKSDNNIKRKIQESRKRLQVLRLQNTFLLNCNNLTDNSSGITKKKKHK